MGEPRSGGSRNQSLGLLQTVVLEALAEVGAIPVATRHGGPSTGDDNPTCRDWAVVGPPGTGKTTWLAKLVDRFGYGVVVVVLTFSRSAAAAFRERQPGTKVRTVYSAAHKAITQRRGDPPEYLSKSHRDELRLRGFDLSVPGEVDLGDIPAARGLTLAVQIMRHTFCTPHAAWNRTPGLSRTPEELAAATSFLATYLDEHDVLDHTALLEELVEAQAREQPTVALVDEAQDLTELEWRAVESLTAGADLRVLVGDPAQAVHGWRGTSPLAFSRRVEQAARGGRAYQLPRTWRCATTVSAYSDLVLKGVRGLPPRTPAKAEHPGGRVRRVAQLGSLAGNLADGREWLLLARNRRFLMQAADTLDGSGVLFWSGGGLKLGLPEKGEVTHRSGNQTWLLSDAVGAVAALALGEAPEAGQGEALRHALRRKAWKASNKPSSWDPDLLVPEANRDLHDGLAGRWLRISRKRGNRWDRWVRRHGAGCLRSEVKVTLRTMHGAKGLEADAVVVLSDWARTPYRAIGQPDADEDRLAYVAVTRARQEVVLVQPTTSRGYPWPAVRRQEVPG